MLKKIKSYKYLAILVIFSLITFVFFTWFLKTEYFSLFKSWAGQYVLFFFVLLVLIKIIGIVWPPLPGGIFTLASIPVLGWFPAYLADFLGSLIGSSVTYSLGKTYGYSFLRKLFSLCFNMCV